MTTNPDYYEILGVLPTSEDVVIRGAYRGLIQKYHPDTFTGDPSEAAIKAREINEAYTVLRDPQKRASYDATRPTIGKDLPADDRYTAAGPAANQQASAFHPATIDKAAVRSAVFKARHILITAGYLAAVLVIGLIVRAVLNTNRTDASSFQPVTQQSTASPTIVSTKATTPARERLVISPSAKSHHPSERRELSLSPPAPAPKAMGARAPIPVPPTELVAKDSRPPLASPSAMETAKDRTQASPPIVQTSPRARMRIARRVPHRHHAAVAYSARQQGPSDEEQTRWLNDRSAASRPRWHQPRGH